ncbi:hypothetical protein N7462_004083 [Penicillium macrosclerotiorum]|uniref:uncharacterized protein n=1 Tax=Penicillium macrosclerotiorum TaxID=303699 RepID=UPI0025494441|nr:uncharacterized protein N7462_004083 [Penicillium macrosclerotiorum]KAJ5689691.1 hypothetical protein N7462_004083 [Penicillium macrosclerotiorum]
MGTLDALDARDTILTTLPIPILTTAKPAVLRSLAMREPRHVMSETPTQLRASPVRDVLGPLLPETEENPSRYSDHPEWGGL